jgi:Fic family protein
MGRYVERTWEGDPDAMGGRRARASFRYQAFVPDLIAGIAPVVPFEVADAAAHAEAAIRALNDRASVGGLEAIGPLLLRTEAVASSRIEGYDVSSLNLARALIDPRAAKGSAQSVAANVSAMEEAIAIADRDRDVSTADLLAIHATLMAGDERARPGQVREEQNWIGGRLGNPSDAAFVPPPEDLVCPLLEDLVGFMARDDLPAVAQAAIAHAQFETIHPFIDGNGRVGRALVHVVLRRRGAARRFVPPVSIVLAARPSAYVDGLTAFREGRVADWVASFSEAAAAAASVSIDLADQVSALQAAWRERAGRPRSDSAAAHPEWGTAVVTDAGPRGGTGGGSSSTTIVAWPPGYTGLRVGSAVEVHDGNGNVVAVTGRHYDRVPGGFAEVGGVQTFWSCDTPS